MRAYLLEVKWLNEGYFPTIEEYMENENVTSCYPIMASLVILGMGKIASKEVMQWSSSINNYPLIIDASAIICRLMDDIVTHEAIQTDKF